MTCPACGLENPPSALYCDCGHGFVLGSEPKKSSLERSKKAPLAEFGFGCVLLIAVSLGLALFDNNSSDKGVSVNTTSKTGTRSSSSNRRVILFNGDATTVTIAQDADALQLAIDLLKSKSDIARARVSAAEVDGKLYKVPNGTRAEVLGDVAVQDMTLIRVRILNGPRSGEEGFCFSSVTQPDTAP